MIPICVLDLSASPCPRWGVLAQRPNSYDMHEFARFISEDPFKPDRNIEDAERRRRDPTRRPNRGHSSLATLRRRLYPGFAVDIGHPNLCISPYFPCKPTSSASALRRVAISCSSDGMSADVLHSTQYPPNIFQNAEMCLGAFSASPPALS